MNSHTGKESEMRVRRIGAVVGLAVLIAAAVVSAGEAGGGTPITACGQTVTTSAFLTRDLYCPGSAGVVVAADGITVDLKGFTLRGDRTSGHYGIDDIDGYEGVTVKNGVVRNFDAGIWAQDADRFGVAGLLASGNAGNGIDIEGAAASLRSSTAAGNGHHGVVFRSKVGKVQSVTAAGNVESGIVAEGAAVSVKSSTASGNGTFGIYADGAAVSVKSSTASGNGGYGIYVSGDAAAISGNRMDANGFAAGVADGGGLGLYVFYAVPPRGTNVARGNDDPAECEPALLCS